MLRTTAAMLALGLALLVAACGGGDDQVDADELQSQIADAQQQVNDQLDELGSVDSTDELQTQANDAAAAIREQADNLADLDVPESVQSARDQFVDSLRTLADQIEERAQNLGDGDLGSMLDQLQGLDRADLEGALDDLRDAGVEIPTVESP